MSAPTKTRQWLLAKRPTGHSASDVFKLVETPLPDLEDGQVLLKLNYLSNDPAQRTWISETIDKERLYTTPVAINEVMRARGITTVIASKSPKLPTGSVVAASVGWSEYLVQDAADCAPIEPIGDLSATHFLGALGLTGLTAYYGLVDVARATSADLVVVSGAAGATGSMAVQIAARLLGCRVIGIAGTDAKCRWVEDLGAEVCLNYKAADFAQALQSATGRAANVYFDNTGGEILDLMLGNMARYGRIAACGSISSYNKRKGEGDVMQNLVEIVMNRLEIKGFIVLDMGDRREAMTQALVQGYKDGKLKISDENESVRETEFEGIPKVWTQLFSGENTGKLITKLK